MPPIDRTPAVFFSNQFRTARLAALADGEAFDEVIHVVERLGSYLEGNVSNLGGYTKKINALAKKSVLFDPATELRGILTPFSELYELVRVARNDALHQGAFARHLSQHAIELAIILEDALSSCFGSTVVDFMVRNPACAELWQPIAFVRQLMLANSYSSLPLLDDAGNWHLVSDAAIARFLGPNRDGWDRKDKLAMTLRKAWEKDRALLQQTAVLPSNASVSVALDRLKAEAALLIVNPSQDKIPSQTGILGILTAFDLL